MSRGARSGPVAVHVVIPAHDEAEGIGRCLASVREAVAELAVGAGVAATVTVVADGCADDTAGIATDLGVDVLTISDRCVGRARDAGARRALELSRSHDPARVWIAMTDADSTVAPNWLVAQLAAATAGAELWLGRVRPDPASMAEPVLRAWWERHHQPGQPPQVYGANLGFTGRVFLDAGGFRALSEHEDVAFVGAVVDTGASWVAGESLVQTSGRTQGRTPGGFAGYVRTLAAEVAHHSA